MAKNGSNNIATILAIGSLIWVGILTKLFLNQNSELLDMKNEVSQLQSNMATMQGRPIDSNAKIDTGPLIVKVEDVKSPFISESATKKLKMRDGYYCLANKVDDRVIIYFDGKGSIKAWGDTDGTEKFVKSHPPEAVGTYAINSTNLFIKAKEQKNGKDFVRRGVVLNSRDDGLVTDFDLLDEVFATCPF